MKYRLKEADGTPVDRTVEDTWRRIARALAAVERDPAAWEDRFYARARGFQVPARGPDHGRAPGTARSVTLFNCFVMGTIPDSMGGHLRGAEGSGADHAAGRRDRLRLLDHPAQGRGVKGVAADASGPLSLHGRLGRDVPHDHVGRLAPRRDDGDDALRPSRHRGLHHGQVRPRAAAELQRLRPRDRRLHGGGQGGRPVGTDLRRQGLPDGAARAICGTGSCARPTTMPSRA